MGKRRRRSALAARRKRTIVREESIFDQMNQAIHKRTLIPIIGDTIRIAHIFDVDMNQDIGVENIEDDVEDEDNGTDDNMGEGGVDLTDYNIIEELAYEWAKSIGYPLSDHYRLARVAQFCTLEEENSTVTKEGYLSFLKHLLLDVAAGQAEIEDDEEGLEIVEELQQEHSLSFADVVDELDYPNFESDHEDPLRILARLPIEVYITTSAFDFLERALEAEGKSPRSQLCFWNLQPENVDPEHRFDPRFEPTEAQPIVYHLLGMEQYPSSIVLSEDDYLDFLWEVARDRPGDSGERIIPPYLEARLNTSSLLLLGYRLQDWDFRVLFRGLLNADRDAILRRGVSVAMQIDPEEQPLVVDETKAKIYLNRYFSAAKFRVEWGDSDNFITKLWSEWQKWNSGGEA